MRVLLLSLLSSACLAAGANIAAAETGLTDDLLDRVTASAVDDRLEEGLSLDRGPFSGWLVSSLRGGAEADPTPLPATASIRTQPPATASITMPPSSDAGRSYAAPPAPVVGAGGGSSMVIETRTSFASGFGGMASTRIESYLNGPGMLLTPSSSAAVIVFN